MRLIKILKPFMKMVDIIDFIKPIPYLFMRILISYCVIYILQQQQIIGRMIYFIVGFYIWYPFFRTYFIRFYNCIEFDDAIHGGGVK